MIGHDLNLIMNIDDVVCERCGRNAAEVTQFGQYLKRINPKGQAGIFVCVYECGRYYGTTQEAVLNAILGD